MTRQLVARDLDSGLVVADRVTVASRRLDRAIGLLRRSHLDAGEGLWINPCRGVHTCFMSFAIDIIAMDDEGVVVDAVSNLKPWRIRLPRSGTVSVLELRAGTLLRTPTNIGHRIQMVGSDPLFTKSVNLTAERLQSCNQLKPADQHEDAKRAKTR